MLLIWPVFSIGTVLFHCLQTTFHCLCICLSYMEMNFAWHRWSCDMAELSHFEDSYTSRNNQCACAVSTWQKWLKPRVRKLLQPELQCRSGSTFWNCLYLVHLMRMGSPYDLHHALTSLRHHFLFDKTSFNIALSYFGSSGSSTSITSWMFRGGAGVGTTFLLQKSLSLQQWEIRCCGSLEDSLFSHNNGCRWSKHPVSTYPL